MNMNTFKTIKIKIARIFPNAVDTSISRELAFMAFVNVIGIISFSHEIVSKH